jgi:AcrR family transcriptional regulator
MDEALRDKTAQLRRQHVLDAAIRAFDAKGFRGATIRDIAQAAGISDGTIYNIFDSKEAILIAIMEKMLGASAMPSKPALATGTPDPGAILRSMIADRWASLTPEVLSMTRTIWSEALVNRDLASLYRERILAPALDAPVDLFGHHAHAGAAAPFDAAATLRLVVASFLGLVLMRLLSGDGLQKPTLQDAENLADLMLKGLLPRREGE